MVPDILRVDQSVFFFYVGTLSKALFIIFIEGDNLNSLKLTQSSERSGPMLSAAIKI